MGSETLKKPGWTSEGQMRVVFLLLLNVILLTAMDLVSPRGFGSDAIAIRIAFLLCLSPILGVVLLFGWPEPPFPVVWTLLAIGAFLWTGFVELMLRHFVDRFHESGTEGYGPLCCGVC